MNQNLARGIFLILFALVFGLQALGYKIGTLAHSGPGLFPLIISGILLFIGVIVTIRSFMVKPIPMSIKYKNIAIIVGSLCGFAIFSELINMSVGIVFLVFFSTLAGVDYSWKRNIILSCALLAIALGFQRLLGLNLTLY